MRAVHWIGSIVLTGMIQGVLGAQGTPGYTPASAARERAAEQAAIARPTTTSSPTSPSQGHVNT